MERPKNILFITTDQQRQESLPCYGLPFMRTPAIDRLAAEGLVFDSCTAASPVCQPVRASFILGQYPHVMGVPDNSRWIRPGSPTIARLFNQAGWNTAAIGKMHFFPWDNPEGFRYRVSAEDKRLIFRRDDWTRFLEANGYSRDHPAVVPGYRKDLGAMVSPLPASMHLDAFIGDEAVKWVENEAEGPFFAWVSFNSPHDPYDPPEELAGLYRDAPIPQPVGTAEELVNKPPYQREMLRRFSNHLLYLTDFTDLSAAKIRKMREHYLATVTLIDQQVEKILKALEARDLLDSTLVVFSSDHGDHLGDHGLPFKHTFYESTLMVPLIARGPGVARGRCAAFVNWLDLHATFLALAGIEIPDHVQGKDISGLLEDPSGSVSDRAFSELLGRTMVRTQTHKLVLCDDGTGELYDLEERPLEVNNHFNDPSFRGIQAELTESIVKHVLAHSRIRSFGGGVHPPDPERDACLVRTKERIERGEFPGL
jgi:arylsulfatase A-like enzyme